MCAFPVSEVKELHETTAGAELLTFKRNLTTMTDHEMGEKELFISELPVTLEALCGMKGTPHDDTIMHRLLDCIKHLITSPEEADRAGVFNFFDATMEKVGDHNPSILVLALGLAAHLVSMTTLPSDKWQKVMSLFDSVQSSVAMENTSVSAAYFNSLASVSHYKAVKEWLEDNRVHLRTALSTIETVQGIFLLKAAEGFVVACTTAFLEASESAAPPSSATVTETFRFLSGVLADMVKGRTSLLDHMIMSSHTSTFHQCAVQIIQSLSSCKQFCEWKCGDIELTAKLSHLALRHPSDKIRFSALQSAANLVASMGDHAQEAFLEREVVIPLLKLVSEGEVERGMTVAATFCKLSRDGVVSGALITLQRLHQLPHDIIFDQQIFDTCLAELVPAVNAVLCNKQKFVRLIPAVLHSIKQAHSCNNLIRLVQSTSTARDSDHWSSLMSTWPKGVGLVIMGNHKLLNSLLHLLQQDYCAELTLEQCKTTLESLLGIMEHPAVESRLYSQTSAVFLNILRNQIRLSGSGESTHMLEVMSQTVCLLERRLVALQWEVRDTTLEFVRDLISIIPDPWFLKLAMERHLLRDAWSCVKDGESYPRASAITLVTSLTMLPEWWSAFLKDCNVSEMSLVNEMAQLLSTDSEAFPRRAAILLLTSMFQHTLDHTHPHHLPPGSSLSSNSAEQRHAICSIMTTAMADFDWEVKAKVLEFWEKMAASVLSDEGCGNGVSSEHQSSIDSCNSNSASGDNSGVQCRIGEAQGKRKIMSDQKCHSLLKDVLQSGFGKAVLAGTGDYDPAVKQKAFRILETIVLRVHLDNETPSKLQKLEAGAQKSVNSRKGLTDDNEESEGLAPTDPVNEFLLAVEQLNPSQQLARLGRGTDEYDLNPSSLLEDVVSAIKTAVKASEVMLMSEDEFEDADDMFIDCY